MVTQERIVAFIDILGFKQMVEDFESGDKGLLSELKRTLDAAIPLFDADNDNLIEHEFIRKWKRSVEYRSFSDCICISVPVQVPDCPVIQNIKLFLQFLGIFQTALLQMEKGYLIRGGVSVGNYHEDRNMIFSMALIEAYELECKEAVFPRILISTKLRELISREILGNEDMLTAYPLLTTFEDQLFFINFLNHDLKDIELMIEYAKKLAEPFRSIVYTAPFEDGSLETKRETIRDIQEKIDNKLAMNNFPDRVLSKYQWVIRFLNHENISTKNAQPAF